MSNHQAWLDEANRLHDGVRGLVSRVMLECMTATSKGSGPVRDLASIETQLSVAADVLCGAIACIQEMAPRAVLTTEDHAVAGDPRA